MDFKIKDNLIYLGNEDNPDAYIKYTVEDGIMSINSTVVKKEMGGQGIAGKLTDRAVEFAREEGYKIKPICSYAVRYFEKKPELKELLA